LNLPIEPANDHSSSEDRFQEFWKQYPRREAKAKAQAIWTKQKLDRHADAILTDVAARIADPLQWSDPQYIPHATTYLNQRRWEDEWRRAPGAPHGRESLVDRNARRASEILGRLPRETNENADAINAESMRRLGMKP